MPPRKNVPPSPATSGRTMAPSPARSTRSTRRGDDEGWEDDSVQSSFRVPAVKRKANSLVALKDTSVNVAAAFHAAQNGHYPTPNPDRPFVSAVKPTSRPAPPPTSGSSRATSPVAEQLYASARALSPVRFFLRSTDDGDEYTSFSSIGSGLKTDASYDYKQEEAFVKAAQAQTRHRLSDGKRKKGKVEDMPYRPAEDDWVGASDDSGGEGEGIVRSGALDGRVESRGKRQEKGEGYLGTGLGFQPRSRRRASKIRQDSEESEEVEEIEGAHSHRGYTPGSVSLDVRQTPRTDYRRSPTPAQILTRAFSPLVDRSSPFRTSESRKRQPSSHRTLITNILHGVVLFLRFIVELATGALRNLLLKPVVSIATSGRALTRHMKAHWAKWLVGCLAMSISLRLLDRSWRAPTTFMAPDLPPSSLEELVGRLTQLEQAVVLLSESSKALADAESEAKATEDTLISKMRVIESSMGAERQRIDDLKVSDSNTVKMLHSSSASLRLEIGGLSDRAMKQETAITSASHEMRRFATIDRDIQALRIRVDQVEHMIMSVFDDGRLKAALDRILPREMPVRRTKEGRVDIDPSFWAEMKRVLLGKGEIEALVRQAISSQSPARPDGEIDMNQSRIEAWGEKFIKQKIQDGLLLTRTDFLSVIDMEVHNLRDDIAALPQRASPPTFTGKVPAPGSSVTIKSSKDDDVTLAFQSLIDAALLRYSKDTLAMPDYALFTAGGRVVPSITTDTLVMSSPSRFARFLLARKPLEGRSPATALLPDISVGSCWPFAGDRGQLGILLNRRVVVSDLTVEHAASEVALDVSTAPREVEVWGLVDGEENKNRVAEYLALQSDPELSNMAFTDRLRLGSFTYDPSAPSHVQTFPVDPDIVALGVDVGIVIFKIQSNWGGDFTCLYRVSGIVAGYKRT